MCLSVAESDHWLKPKPQTTAKATIASQRCDFGRYSTALARSIVARRYSSETTPYAAQSLLSTRAGTNRIGGRKIVPSAPAHVRSKRGALPPPTVRSRAKRRATAGRPLHRQNGQHYCPKGQPSLQGRSGRPATAPPMRFAPLRNVSKGAIWAVDLAKSIAVHANIQNAMTADQVMTPE
jgi:hypothetical protein